MKNFSALVNIKSYLRGVVSIQGGEGHSSD